MLFFKQWPVSYNTPYEKIGDEVRSLADEVPFDIPDSWEWVRLGELFQHNTGKALNAANRTGQLKQYITTSNLYWDRFELDNLKEMYFSESEIEKCTVIKGDLLVCEGGDIGRASIWSYDYPMCIQNHIHRLRAYVPLCTRFFYYLFDLYKHIGWIGGKGIGIQGLSSNAIHSLLFPLPPLAEQHRIVETIDKLQPYTDAYADVESTLDTLNTTFPERLKKSILQEAVQGKLVPQDSSDEPAEALLERIRAEKRRLIKEGKIKKDKHESVIFRRDNSHYEKLDGTERCIDDKLPFEIPDTWIWTRLNTLGYTQTGNTPSTAHPEYRGDYIPFITPGDIADGSIDYTNQGLSEVGKNVARVCPADSILQVCIGGSIGKAALSISEVTFNQQINAITPIFASSKYVFAVLTSFAFLSAMKESAGGTATPILNRSLWDKMYIPVPPLAEQNRIVQRIEELLPLVKGL